MLAWREFPTGEAALFREADGGGDYRDLDAPRNAPAKTPEAHLDKLFFHSQLDLLEVQLVASVTISHAAITAAAAPSGSTSQSQRFVWGGFTDDHLLVDLTALGLSREPICMVAADGRMISGVQPVQTGTLGRARYASVYSTTTEVRLYEEASRANTDLPAVDITYTVWVLRDPPGPVGNTLRQFDPETGETVLGFERFGSLRRYVQVALGGSPLALLKGRGLDLDCGAPRFLRAGTTPYEPVPVGFALTIIPGTGSFGAALAYAGSFVGSGDVEVQAP